MITVQLDKKKTGAYIEFTIDGNSLLNILKEAIDSKEIRIQFHSDEVKLYTKDLSLKLCK